VGGAALLGPPPLQLYPPMVAGMVREGGEEAVDPDQVGQPWGVGQGEGAVAAVANQGGAEGT
jgi:hypothetical protein